MSENKYYTEIENVIQNIEINSKVRAIKENSEKLEGYWKIGKLLVEAQNGEKRAEYGSGLIKKWSLMLTNKYGSNYSVRNLELFRKFYLFVGKTYTVCTNLNWSHYRYILSIKNENERNYYINQVILNNLSVRELKQEIKTKSFERLSYADKENIKLVTDNTYSLTIEDMIKDPILIKINNNIQKLEEKVLHKYIIQMLEEKFLELGAGFALVGHEYIIKIPNHVNHYRLDLLFFNTKLNCYVVVEVKTNTMKIKDCDQLDFYTNLVDKYIKENNKNKTIGLLIAKEKNSFVIKYATSKNIFTTTYQLISNKN